MQSIIFPIIRFMHDLFTATWVGGLIVLSFVVLPALKKNAAIKEPKIAIRAIQNRMKTPAIISMIGLAVTGMLLSKQSVTGFSRLFDFSQTHLVWLSIKHILMIVMVLLAVIRLTLNKKNESKKEGKLEKMSALVLFVNTFIGVVVLFLSAILSVMS